MKRTRNAKPNPREVVFYLGIDPGAGGAIACICDNQNMPKTHPFQWIEDYPGDEVAAANIIRNFLYHASGGPSAVVAALEKVHSMPREGVSSAFKFGTSYGIWRGILASFEIPFMQPTPQAWQKGIPERGVGDKKKAKTAIVTYASQLFPSAAPLLRGPKGGIKDGRADALMIAEWRRRQG